MRHVPNSPGLVVEPLQNRSTDGGTSLPPWLPEDRTVLLACARHGLYHGWRALRLPAGSVVLVPAFVCDTVTEPLRLAGAKLAFFGVREDLSPDLDHAGEVAAKAVRRGRTGVRALLWYRYLGFSNGIAEAHAFCRDRRLFFIEDCAHGLPVGQPGPPAGSWGDFAVFSLRKVLPVTNAGALVVSNRGLLPVPELRWRRPGAVYQQALQDKAHAMELRAAESGPGGRRLAREALLRHIEAVGRMNSPRPSVRLATRSHWHDADLPLHQMARPVAPDMLSRRVIQNADLPRIVQARRRNYREYLRRLGELALFPRPPTRRFSADPALPPGPGQRGCRVRLPRGHAGVAVRADQQSPLTDVRASPAVARPRVNP